MGRGGSVSGRDGGRCACLHGFIGGMPGGLEGKPSLSVAVVCFGVYALLVVMWSPGGGEKVEASCGVSCRGCGGAVSCWGGVASRLSMNDVINLSVR